MIRPRDDDAERGSAIIEFVLLTVVVLVPIVFGIAALSLVQRASYAASGAARDAARMYATASDPAQGSVRAQAAANIIFGDYSVAEGSSVVTDCLGSCLAPGSKVRARATVLVPLPGLTAVFGRHDLTTIRITSAQVSPVDEFKAAS